MQHKDNPVNWYGWGEDAFVQAEKENKPILLSIGYASCHWCHVMAHESFEDSTVAELMNKKNVYAKSLNLKKYKPRIVKPKKGICIFKIIPIKTNNINPFSFLRHTKIISF